MMRTRFFILLGFMLLSLGLVQATRQGGSLQIVMSEAHKGDGVVILQGYAGKPMTALQFELTGGKGIRFMDVRPGTGVEDERLWSVNTVVASEQSPAATRGEDTIRVVLFARTTAGLASSSNTAILKFSVANDSKSIQRAVIRLAGVVGALPTGERAGVIAGAERTLARNKLKQ
jgi:hypothetical protein